MTTPAPAPTGSLTAQMYQALCGHYRRPDITGGDGEILLPEVQAPGSNRRCDLLRIGLWPSRGYGIDVHEIKTSRSDWLRELDNPGKADAWWEYSSRFWIVAPPKMIQPEELPPGWGLMEPPAGAGRRRFKVVVKPETREPKLTVVLLAHLVTRVENLRAEQIRLLRQDHRNEVYQAEQRGRAQAAAAKMPSDVRNRLDLLERLEALLGFRLDEFGFDRPGEPARVTPFELGAALAEYTHDHVALQRSLDRLAEAQGRLRRAAETAMNTLRTDQ
ncbi:hypothetical protein [Nonomuraea glycinis]|uniref:hypothetical protein n=1 Tax=Nonomuraea glycinis TaxID=2047744 RepID=UPI0033ACED5B